MKRGKMKTKKGISPIIATILLILMSISAVTIIYSVVFPFIRGRLDESKCFETLEQLTIDTESGYTCYYDEGESKIVNITIKRGEKEAEIANFKIFVAGEGMSKAFEISETTTDPVRMLSGSTTIELPNLGEERTYSLNTSLKEVLYAEVYPILENGKMCEKTNKADIEECI